MPREGVCLDGMSTKKEITTQKMFKLNEVKLSTAVRPAKERVKQHKRSEHSINSVAGGLSVIGSSWSFTTGCKRAFFCSRSPWTMVQTSYQRYAKHTDRLTVHDYLSAKICSSMLSVRYGDCTGTVHLTQTRHHRSDTSLQIVTSQNWRHTSKWSIFLKDGIGTEIPRASGKTWRPHAYADTTIRGRCWHKIQSEKESRTEITDDYRQTRRRNRRAARCDLKNTLCDGEAPNVTYIPDAKPRKCDGPCNITPHHEHIGCLNTEDHRRNNRSDEQDANQHEHNRRQSQNRSYNHSYQNPQVEKKARKKKEKEGKLGKRTKVNKRYLNNKTSCLLYFVWLALIYSNNPEPHSREPDEIKKSELLLYQDRLQQWPLSSTNAPHA